MREDMFKVIVERPRHGVRTAPRFKLRHDKDVGRKHAGLKRQIIEQHGYLKSLNENLAPLRRYLHKQKGRNWDAVFSEICARLDTGSTVKMHVREHIEDFVMLRISISKDGTWLGGNSNYHHPHPLEDWRADLYVDPYDNVLKETKTLRKKMGVKRRRYAWPQSANPRPDLVQWQIKHLLAFIKIKGCWFRVAFSCDVELNDEYLHKDIENTQRDTHLKSTITTKTQLSKKQLKRHGLINGHTKNGDAHVYG